MGGGPLLSGWTSTPHGRVFRGTPSVANASTSIETISHPLCTPESKSRPSIGATQKALGTDANEAGQSGRPGTRRSVPFETWHTHLSSQHGNPVYGGNASAVRLGHGRSSDTRAAALTCRRARSYRLFWTKCSRVASIQPPAFRCFWLSADWLVHDGSSQRSTRARVPSFREDARRSHLSGHGIAALPPVGVPSEPNTSPPWSWPRRDNAATSFWNVSHGADRARTICYGTTSCSDSGRLLWSRWPARPRLPERIRAPR